MPQNAEPGTPRRAALFLAATGVLALVALLSLRIGSLTVSTEDAIRALLNYSQESYTQTVVRALRLPRTIIGLGVGAALAVAGAAMQAVTRNPLAGPAILSVNSGAAFAVVVAIFVGELTRPLHYVWFAFAGAFAASVLVYAIGSAGRGGASPAKLALAGVIVSSLLSSWLTALLLLDRQTLDIVRFWLAGSLADRDMRVFLSVAPFLAVGIGGSVLLGHQLNILSLGEESARALGMRVGRVRLLVATLVVLMSGAAVAAVGPVGFIGLAVPHIVRILSGPDYRWILAFCLVVGPAVLLGADILGRVVARPNELQVGIVTAMVGAPFLISLARRRRTPDV